MEGQNKSAVARLIHVSNLHTKFGWISSKSLGGDSGALTLGFLLGTYSVSKSTQESVSIQQIPKKFSGINLILS